MRLYIPLKASMHGDKLERVAVGAVQELMRLHATHAAVDTRYLAADFGALDLEVYRAYNVQMARKTYECDDTAELEYGAHTNAAFAELRQCHLALQERAGWKLAHDSALHFELRAAHLLRGLFPAFAERVDDLPFLANMTSPDWGNAAWRGQNEHARCFKRGAAVELMNPALPGAFDLALGCDTVRGRLCASCGNL